MNAYPQFYNIVASRYSCRKYTSAPVDRELIMAVLDTVRLAPSACNRQPWQFLVLDTEESRRPILECYDRPWVGNVPVFIVALGMKDEAWVREYDGKNHVDIDVAIAVEHLCLAATSLGLGTCWICHFDPKALSEKLRLPDGVEPVAIIPLGHPDPDMAEPKKNRRAFDEVVRWEKF
ncbi:MAG: nitroreductase family protein [Muribaculum sp.]|nr:nitroreductase family protein [Muribaculum sp.]